MEERMAITRDLTAEELAKVQRHMAAGPINDAKLLEILEEDRDTGGTEETALLGGGYRLGNIDIPPLSAGALVLLDLIDSPFLEGKIGTLKSIDVATAIYVLAVGPEAVRPISGLTRRQRGLAKAEKLAATDPEFFAEYLSALDRIAAAWGDFEMAALEFWGQVETVSMQEAADVIMQAMADAFGGFEMLPKGDGSKKNDSMPSGSAESAT
jgi:hypothetical protein